MGSLIGKKALVTGASRGIGAAIAKRLAAEGADVAVTYVHSEAAARLVVETIEKQGRRGLAIQADSADPKALKRAVDEAARILGGLDILVNNAGIFKGGALESLTVEDIDATLAVNVRAVVVASQAAAAHMGDGGRIISIGSCLAERVTQPGIGLYSLRKAALDGWWRKRLNAA